MTKQKKTVYEIVTEQILARLEQGTIPWHKPWRGGAAFEPKSFSSRKPYRGIMRKGEKGTMIVLWKPFIGKQDKDKPADEQRTRFMLRYYHVFNLDQIENLDETKLPADAKPDTDDQLLDFVPIQRCEHIVEHMPDRPEIKHSEQRRAFYQPAGDYVHMPNREHFEAEEPYYSTMFHELAHSTGHKSRLDRPKFALASFGSCDYSKEELVAEFTAAMLCGIAGIENSIIDNASAYIKSWSRKLKEEPKWLVQAAAQAQKASDFILDRKRVA
jgi:antirestriction protein ArdC